MRVRLLLGATLALAGTGLAATMALESQLFPESASQTIEDLKIAYMGETTANAKYAAYALKAREEGYKDVAALFRAASEAERIHARKHRAVLMELGAHPAPGF